MLLDSNIVIYSAQPENEFLRRLIAEKVPAVSAVSYVEVLGYHRLAEAERRYFESFFAEPFRRALIQLPSSLSLRGQACGDPSHDCDRRPKLAM